MVVGAGASDTGPAGHFGYGYSLLTNLCHEQHCGLHQQLAGFQGLGLSAVFDIGSFSAFRLCGVVPDRRIPGQFWPVLEFFRQQGAIEYQLVIGFTKKPGLLVPATFLLELGDGQE